MGEFTANFVDEVYPTDEDVARDSVVQAWATEMTDSSKAGVRGFPTAFKDKATLALAMQCMWWVASAFHGAINTSQFDVSSASATINVFHLSSSHTYISFQQTVLCIHTQQASELENEHGAIQRTRRRHVGVHL